MIFAAIDIGSNAIRLLIEESKVVSKNDFYFKKISLTRIPLRLGKDVFSKGYVTEKTKSKLYAGGIGYFTANSEFDTCIALRTALAKNKKFYVQAGAGIVADSKPLNEYKETVNKAKALINALK